MKVKIWYLPPPDNYWKEAEIETDRLNGCIVVFPAFAINGDRPIERFIIPAIGDFPICAFTFKDPTTEKPVKNEDIYDAFLLFHAGRLSDDSAT